MNIKPTSPQAIPLDQAKKLAEGQDRRFIPEPYLDVAKSMEQQFVEFMMNEMQKTTGEEIQGAGADFYKGLMNTQNAEQMVNNRGGIGIQNVILDQIYPKHLRSEMAYNGYKKQVEAQNANKPSMIRMHIDNPTEQEIKATIEDSLKAFNRPGKEAIDE